MQYNILIYMCNQFHRKIIDFSFFVFSSPGILFAVMTDKSVKMLYNVLWCYWDYNSEIVIGDGSLPERIDGSGTGLTPMFIKYILRFVLRGYILIHKRD